MSTLLITQARVSSSRLNAKTLLKLGNATVLDLHLKRLKKSKLVDHFCVAIADEPGAEKLIEIANRNGFEAKLGSVHDVLDRFYQVAKNRHPTEVVRVTSDCPLIDAAYVDDLIEKFRAGRFDYATNCLKPTLPDGMSAEVCTFAALEKAWNEAKLKSEREHVTPYIWKNSNLSDGHIFKALNATYAPDRSQQRMTLDYPHDYDVIVSLVELCGEEASMETYSNALSAHPELAEKNSASTRLEGYRKSLKQD